MTIKVTEFNKDVSVSIMFDTDRVSFGNNELTYHTQKYGMTKAQQKKYILRKLKKHQKEISKAIDLLKEE